jgi:uncharacterized membrane protein YadS
VSSNSDPSPTAHGREFSQPLRRGWIQSEDWLAVLLGGLVLVVALIATGSGVSPRYAELNQEITQIEGDLQQLQAQAQPLSAEQKAIVAAREEKLEALSAQLFQNPLKPLLAKVGSWNANPADAFYSKGKFILPGLLTTLAGCLLVFGLGAALQGKPVHYFAPAFVVIFLLATVAYVLAGQSVIKNYNLEYALWALLIGMLISNTIGTPRALRPAIQTELYIKTGLVLLGAEILLSRLLVLGLPGIFVSWVVTPIVLISTYLFGQYVLRMQSRSLNMVISADMSVCGVSAAIATAAACRAKKEELSLAIGLSLSFTVIMMVVMPMLIRAIGMSEVLGGAWLGGTIDSTGAVAAAGGMLGPTALAVAATVKMIQNILIGVVAFGVAVYWVTVVERGDGGPRPRASEIWLRFPKFVIGFVAASLVFSWIYSLGTGQALTEAAISGTSEILRGWFFCLAFVSIGLETNFRELSAYMKGGKPLVLYVCGQALNLVLTLLMAWVMFEKVFPQAASALGN